MTEPPRHRKEAMLLHQDAALGDNASTIDGSADAPLPLPRSREGVTGPVKALTTATRPAPGRVAAEVTALLCASINLMVMHDASITDVSVAIRCTPSLLSEKRDVRNLGSGTLEDVRQRALEWRTSLRSFALASSRRLAMIH